MKKIIIPVIALLTLACACTENFEEMNTSETSLTVDAIQPAYVLERTIYHGLSNDHQRNFDLYDYHYAHYIAEAGIGDVGRYNYRDDWGGINWRDFYTERLPEYWLIKEYCDKQGSGYNAFQAVNDIWNVYLWTRIVDRNGDAPYLDEEGNFAAGQGNVLAYSKQKDIYLDLLKRLSADVTALASTSGQALIDSNYDVLYSGDYSKWSKFANTLIMRLSMRLSRTDAASEAKTYYQAAEGKAMNSPSDYARVSCDSSIWGDYFDRTARDWGESRPDEMFVKILCGENPGYMTGVVDPRRDIWLHEGTDPALTGTNWDGLADGTYTLGDMSNVVTSHGGSNSFALLNYYDANGFFWFANNASANQNLSWCIATYSETLFLKAEAALRGWSSGDAESLYKQAIKASMDEVCYFITRSGGDKTISDAEFNAYYAALPAFGSSNEAKLKSIMTQKWIALFPNAQEAWCEIRRTGYPQVGVVSYPVLSPSAQVQNGNLIQRMCYPDNEYNTNADNIPDDYKTDGSKYQYRGQYGLYWSQAGEGGTLSKDAAPSNF